MPGNRRPSPKFNFEADRTSLTGSLCDFSDSDKQQSPAFGLPSQHSGFRSSSLDPESDKENSRRRADRMHAESEGESGGDDNDIASDDSPWSPPAWRRPEQSPKAQGWYRHQPYAQDPQKAKSKSPSRSGSKAHSKGTTPGAYESSSSEGEPFDDEDMTLAARIPLPKGSLSPERQTSPLKDGQNASSSRASPEKGKGDGIFEDKEDSEQPSSPNNFIRFALRAEVQQRTEPIEAVVTWIQSTWSSAKKSWGSLYSSLMFISIAIFFTKLFFTEPHFPPVPDILKMAQVTENFEPVIFYSENGVGHISELQETGVAVWDLGESVRAANMTSGEIIVEQLDSLSDSLKGLSIELTKFFTSVDGDIDGILIFMDWARRELGALDPRPPSSLSTAHINLHTMLTSVGLLEYDATSTPTPLGLLFNAFFGITRSQRNQFTLQRTFNDFLSVLEESINSELTYSTRIFMHFEGIDRQFLNLQRTVIRESDAQERQESEFLSSLWTRLVGAHSATLRKYEKNKALLASLRLKTLRNKGLLIEHQGRLHAIKGNLEVLRQKLISPLVRSSTASATAGENALSVAAQIRGLDYTYGYLKDIRDQQKTRMLEMLYAPPRRTVSIEGP